MRFLGRKSQAPPDPKTNNAVVPEPEPAPVVAKQRVALLTYFLGVVTSIGGFMFGYVRFD